MDIKIWPTYPENCCPNFFFWQKYGSKIPYLPTVRTYVRTFVVCFFWTLPLETTEIYVDIPVPPENSSLSEYVSNYLCTSYLVEKKCEDACQQYVQAEKSSKISELNEAELIIIILKRGVPTLDGYKIVDSAVSATENLFVRYN